jgi:hypothetical protein
MGAIGSDGVVNRANTSTGFALHVNSKTYLQGEVGQSVGGSGLSAIYAIPSSIVINYIAIQDSNASPDGVFSAQNSSDLGNNTGWIFA